MLDYFPKLRLVVDEVALHYLGRVPDDWHDRVHDVLPEPDECEAIDEMLGTYCDEDLRGFIRGGEIAEGELLRALRELCRRSYKNA